MKIAMFSNNGLKFMEDIKEYWEKKGHQVFYEPGANPALTAECDLTYIDCLDSNFYCLFNGPGGDHEAPDWKPYPKKGPIWVRGIDLDLWMGRHRDPRIWPYMDGMIVINKFYENMVQKEGNLPVGKLHMIHCGVNLEKFKFREKPNTYKIAVVTGNLWEAKAAYEAIRIFQEICRLSPNKFWELHIRGQHVAPEWHRVSYDHLIEISGLKDRIFIHPQTPDMNSWYQDKDYILVTSHKEAFSYAAAEGMAVGLKPVINNFFGSEELWDRKYLFNSFNEAITKILDENIDSEEYRAYIEKHYDVKDMLKTYDQLMGT